jgi:hypothetical protein
MTRRETIQYLSIILGGSISAPAMAGLMGEKLNLATFINISAEQEALIAEIADVIIPTTSTPGAKAAGVQKYIVRMIQDCFTKEKQEQFIRGLALIETESQAKFQKNFKQIDFLQKEEIIKQSTQNNKDFFHQIKELTVIGYFTSEIGATKALVYQAIPGKYIGCMPLKSGQKAWAL